MATFFHSDKVLDTIRMTVLRWELIIVFLYNKIVLVVTVLWHKLNTEEAGYKLAGTCVSIFMTSAQLSSIRGKLEFMVNRGFFFLTFIHL